MDIACPNCNAAYRVPDALLLQRKPLRCAACGHAWVPELPAEVPPLPVAPILAAAVAQTAPPPVAPRPEPEPARAEAPPAAPPAPTPVAEEAEAAPPPRPVRSPSTPPPLADRKWPGGRRGGEREDEEDEEQEVLRPRRPRRQLSGALLFLAWAVSIALVGGTLTALYVARADVAEAWSPFLRVVSLIGG